MLTIPAKIIATCFALVAFAAALVIGALVGNPLGTVLFRALVAMCICWLVGYLVGLVAQRTVELNIARYKQAHPIVADADAVSAASPEQGPPGAADGDVNPQTTARSNGPGGPRNEFRSASADAPPGVATGAGG